MGLKPRIHRKEMIDLLSQYTTTVRWSDIPATWIFSSIPEVEELSGITEPLSAMHVYIPFLIHSLVSHLSLPALATVVEHHRVAMFHDQAHTHPGSHIQKLRPRIDEILALESRGWSPP